METLNPHINLENLESPKAVSLYRAACYIAFDEKPLKERLSELAYVSRNNYPEYRQTPMYLVNDEFITWNSVEERNSFNLACNALLLWLLHGDVEATGSPLLNRKEEIEEGKRMFFRYESSFNVQQKIPKEFWGTFVEISWYGNEAENYFAEHDCHEGHPLAFDSIEISVSSLLSAKSKNLDKPPNARGRKAKYNWEEFYLALVVKAQHPDGIPPLQADLEREMAEWCINNNWPDQPSESVLRSKISPIYQQIKKAGNKV